MPNSPDGNWHDFGGTGALLHFAHANGYPPDAYRILVTLLTREFHVFAGNARPLWPDADPQDLQDWRLLADDLLEMLNSHSDTPWIGVGHSMGATSTLRAALRAPELFRALVLIDPVLFPPWLSPIWELAYRTGLAYRLHPLAAGALRRRTKFESLAAMESQYRQKGVFRRIDDRSLHAYAAAISRPGLDGSVQLVYPPEWEARIYVTAMRADRELWAQLHDLIPPVLLLRGAESDTFRPYTARLFRRQLPNAEIYSVPQSGHLLPLEKPGQVASFICEFIHPHLSR